MLCLVVLVLVSIIQNIHAVKPDYVEYDLDNVEQHFQQYIHDFNKTYESVEEYQTRLEIFKNKLHHINKRNKEDDTAVYGVNQFTDLTYEEINQRYKGLKVNRSNTETVRYVPRGTPPDSFDWRSKGVVTPVKDQARCGSCYIFSAIGSFEGQYAIKHGKLVTLSEQQALDCDKIDEGCGGGWVENVDKALMQQGGLMASSDYFPYKAEVDVCRTDKSKITAKVKPGKSLTFDKEEDIKDALFTNGPLSIALYFSDNLFDYEGGVEKGDDCPTGSEVFVNHALVLVGYGEDDGVPYWLIKNSWSERYGDKGYLRLIRGKNACFIKSHVYLVDVE